MADKKKRTPKQKRDSRRWSSTTTHDVPEGPQGQPGHKAGTELHVVQVVEYGDLGRVTFPAPTPSTLLLNSAEKHLKRAVKLQAQLPSQTKAGKWMQPYADRSFRNRDLLYDFFQEAMAGVLLAHAALEAFANELLPDDFTFEHKGKELDRGALENMGLEWRLSAVAEKATGEANLMTTNPDLWDSVVGLKKLRDDIAHPKAHHAYSRTDHVGTIFARLLNHTDLTSLIATVEAVTQHYGPKVVRTYKVTVDRGGSRQDEPE